MWRLAYRIFRAVSGIQYWMERHLTRAGWLVLGGAVAAGALGVDTSLTLAYKIFTLLAALLVVAMAASRLGGARYAVERSLPRMVTAGQAFSYRVRIVNTGGQRLDEVLLLDGITDPRPDYAEFRARRGIPTYREWKRLIAQRQIVHIDECALPALAPHGECELTISAESFRRGIAHFSQATLARADPLGIFRHLSVVHAPANVLVLPRRYDIKPVDLPGSRHYQPGGMTLATSVGESEEFIGLREYRPGDPLQRIHWKSFARAGKPIVREYQDEFLERHALVLDTFGSAADEIAFEEAISVAASFACTIHTQECMLDLMFVGAEPYCYTAGRGQLQTANLMEILAGVRICADKPFRVLSDAVLAQRAMFASAICILLAWDAAREEFVRQLRQSGIPIRVLVMTGNGIADKPAWLKVLVPGRVQEGLAAL